MNTPVPGGPPRSPSPTDPEYRSTQGASRAAKPAREARFTLDAPEHSGTITGAMGPDSVVHYVNPTAVIFTLNQDSS